MYLRSFSSPESYLGFLDRHGADQDRLAAAMAVGDLGDDGAGFFP